MTINRHQPAGALPAAPKDSPCDRRHVLQLLLALGFTPAAAGTLLAQSTPSLFHPLAGAGRPSLRFGDEWTWGECGGQYKIHAGLDLMCRAGTPVYAPYDGNVRAQFDSTQGWKTCVVIEHQDSRRNLFTTTLWHLKLDRSLSSVRRRIQIATVADLEGLSGNHLHFGLRLARYSETAKRGALPVTAGCGDPAFPEKFVRPL